MWNDITNFIDKLFNTPVAIILTIAFCLIIIIWVVFSKTSFGKKNIKKLNDGFDKTQSYVNELSKNFDQLDSDIAFQIHSLETSNDAFVENQKFMVTALYSYYESFRTDIIKVLEKLPNAKVQEQLKLFKDTLTQQEDDVKAVLNTENGIHLLREMRFEIQQLKQLLSIEQNEPQQADLNRNTEELNNGEQQESTNKAEE